MNIKQTACSENYNISGNCTETATNIAHLSNYTGKQASFTDTKVRVDNAVVQRAHANYRWKRRISTIRIKTTHVAGMYTDVDDEENVTTSLNG